MDMGYVLLIIDEIREEWHQPPTQYYHRKKVDFMYQSYMHSAMDEIKIYLIEHINEDPISAMEEFKYRMSCFACNAKNENTNFMFSVYCEVANDVLDVLRGMVE